ncbi:MAG: 30S ribosomal protein S4e, partial [Candidatus Poseidoniales archaeon]
MSSNHLKRLAMPRSWPITRKTDIWVSRPNPGAHSLDLCIPVGVVIRDILQFANTMREVRYILQAGKVSVDGKV